MPYYSAAKVKEEWGFGVLLDKPLITIKAKNYDEAIEKAIKKLRLKKGNTLSIIRIGGKQTKTVFGLPGRYTVKI